MRACPVGSPIKAHAPVCVSGFQHPALAVAPERSIGVALGSDLVDHSQKMTVAARAMAEKKTVGQRP